MHIGTKEIDGLRAGGTLAVCETTREDLDALTDRVLLLLQHVFGLNVRIETEYRRHAASDGGLWITYITMAK